jgi:sodium-dependent dicarboxylate transporter 2/3/5
VGVLAAIPEEKASAPSRYASALILSVAFGASVGGIGTPVGTPPNIIGIGMIGKLAGRNVSFFEWTAVGVPALLVILPLMLLMLIVLHPAPPETLAGVLDHVDRERRRLGRVGRGEIAALSAFAAAVVLWVTPGIAGLALGAESPAAKALAERLPEGPVALLAAGILFVFPTDWKAREFALDWKTASSIDWGTVMLFGGGMSLGAMMFSTGLAKTIGEAILSITGAAPAAASAAGGAVSGAGSAALFTAISILAGILVSEATSNTASASMVIPVVIAIAKERGLDPLIPAIGACLGCSFGFALPVSTAPNALAYGTGRVPITRMLRAGLLLDLLGFVAIWGVLMLLAPVIGRF